MNRESKIDDSTLYLAVLQDYETRVGDVFVISHNEAILSCSLPSHTAEFLSIVAWVTSEGVTLTNSRRGIDQYSAGVCVVSVWSQNIENIQNCAFFVFQSWPACCLERRMCGIVMG